MKSLKTLLGVALSMAATAYAQEHAAHGMHDSHAGHQSVASSPYAGMQSRTIKALSEQQLADLRAGKGMGLALPAELNGYPGPAHVLELKQPLGLTEEQARGTQALLERMKQETRTIGEEVVASETALDRLFSERRASADTVSQATADAARAQGRLRAAHLKYHLAMMDILTPAQVELYQSLRGYR